MSDKKKIAAMIVAGALVVAGYFLKIDFKGMVCGTEAQPTSQSSSQSEGK